MGCCASQPIVNAQHEIGLVSVPVANATTGLGEGRPEGRSEEGSDGVKQTSKIEIDSFKGNTFVNQYLIIKDLGSGSFGRVKLCLNLDDNALYALKVVNKKLLRRRLFAGKRDRKATADEDLLKEINVMKSLKHKNVVELFEVIDDPTDDKLLMVMEYIEGGEVVSEDHLVSRNRRAFSEDIARMHFRDLIKGLDYLHYQNVIHRDIKPENMLLTDKGSVKLSDFGSACVLPNGDDTMYDTCGTRAFFAPEMCSRDCYGGKKADIYAAGVVLYVMLFNRLPFESDHLGELFDKIQNQKPDFAGRSLSPDAIDLLTRLLEKQPERRMGLEDIMKHDWFTNRSSLRAIQSSRVLSVPMVKADKSYGLTPSIHTVFDRIPDKKIKHFSVGSTIVKEGETMTGFVLIKKGLCVVVSSDYASRKDSSDVDGDTDFHEDEGRLSTEAAPRSEEGKILLNALSQPSCELTSAAEQELSRFTSLNRSDVVKGVGRRTTYQHSKLKELVVQAAGQDLTKGSQPRANGKTRKGPGSIIGLDLAVEEETRSRVTVRVVEPVEAVYVRKRALDEVFSGAESQLQLRLLVAKLQRTELLKETVQKLSDLHSDFLHMEQLRSLVRNVSVGQSQTNTKQ